MVGMALIKKRRILTFKLARAGGEKISQIPIRPINKSHNVDQRNCWVAY